MYEKIIVDVKLFKNKVLYWYHLKSSLYEQYIFVKYTIW